ncbi:hypothetical protein NDU88_001836 [Pleurodeles waltl]|uniref:Reverse transcriptase domain-containing protein n=1 Tax=Pleurodeles waltl TaxID=8319 RepID=A0AAV7W170_PLEWA|nr:hypothetical protein NDU88_001836 [Pleurodeles waltl]
MNQNPPPGFVLDLAHLALARNYFKFEENFFLQTQGTSMGSTFAPSLACLYVENFEKSAVLNDDNPYRDQIRLWKRYIDDVLLIWTGSKEEALAFAAWLNGANPFLTFTMNIGDNKLLFLDLLIYEHEGGLSTEVYYKPTDRNNLLQYQSFHPRALRDNLPVGQFLRLRRNCEKSLGFFPKCWNTSIPGVPRGTAPILTLAHAWTLSFLSRRPPRVLPPLGLPF